MQLENGDYFVITRGPEIQPLNIFSALFGQSEDWKEAKPVYDKSCNGVVFRANNVCDHMVACEIVFAPEIVGSVIGRKMSLDLREIEVFTVTPQYVEALNAGRTSSPA